MGRVDLVDTDYFVGVGLDTETGYGQGEVPDTGNQVDVELADKDSDGAADPVSHGVGHEEHEYAGCLIHGKQEHDVC